VLGTRDYTGKNGFKKVLLGLSGGIDSSITAAIAVAALGAENVVGVSMPSAFNSPETISDAEKLAKNLGIEFHTIPIGPILDRFLSRFEPGWRRGDCVRELAGRIAAVSRCRYNCPVTRASTGNKSGRRLVPTLGDTAGAGIIKDVPKTVAYEGRA
jgi:NAD+ synthetase